MSKEEEDYDEISTKDGPVKIILPETGEEWESLPKAIPNFIPSGVNLGNDTDRWNSCYLDCGEVMLEGGPMPPDDGKLWELGSPTKLFGEGFERIYCVQANEFKSFLLEHKALGKETISVDSVLEEFDKMFGTTLDGKI